MAKRLTDTEKWNKVWYRKLSPVYKCLWIYLLDSCNHSGIWEVDFETAEHFIGSPINQKEVEEVFKKQFEVINGGSRWFIRDFVDFQYGELNPYSKVHQSVIRELEKQRVSIQYPKGIHTPMDKDKDNNKDNNIVEFESIWKQYPKPVGKKQALRHFNASVSTEKDLIDIKQALQNYLTYIKDQKTDIRYVKNGDTWFNNWRDFVDFKPKVELTELEQFKKKWNIGDK